MDFKLSREQEMLREMVRDFAQREIAPKVLSLDEKGEFPYELVKRMAELGLLGIYTPKEYGGSNLGYLARTIVLEEVSRVYPPLAFFCEGNDGALYVLQAFGSEAQKVKYLPKLCSGEKISCFAVTEATGGSSPSDMGTTAEAVADGYIINGRKMFITLGGIADYCALVAKTGDKFSAFLVERGTPGFEVVRSENMLGLRGIPISELSFTNCRVSAENRVGAEGIGLSVALATIAVIARPGVAGVALGIARGAFEEAWKFAKERKLYGAPIIGLQAIQFSLADMETEVEASKWLCYYSSWLLDQGKSAREAARDTARAKLFTTEAARRIAVKATEIMGGYGVVGEYKVIRRLNDALALLPAAGTSEIMRLTIGRELAR